jgi:hypothetical protein
VTPCGVERRDADRRIEGDLRGGRALEAIGKPSGPKIVALALRKSAVRQVLTS